MRVTLLPARPVAMHNLARLAFQRQICRLPVVWLPPSPLIGSRGFISSTFRAAAQDSGSFSNLDGQVNSQLISNMKQKIGDALETEQVDIVDVNGDGRHVSISVVSHLFEGQNSVKRQRLVYKAIWEELQDVVHAVDSMSTKTPEEAEK